MIRYASPNHGTGMGGFLGRGNKPKLTNPNQYVAPLTSEYVVILESAITRAIPVPMYEEQFVTKGVGKNKYQRNRMYPSNSEGGFHYVRINSPLKNSGAGDIWM